MIAAGFAAHTITIPSSMESKMVKPWGALAGFPTMGCAERRAVCEPPVGVSVAASTCAILLLYHLSLTYPRDTIDKPAFVVGDQQTTITSDRYSRGPAVHCYAVAVEEAGHEVFRLASDLPIS